MRAATTLVVLVATSALAAAAIAAARPTIRLADDHPVVVAGTGFKARERVLVRLTIHGKSTYARRITAGTRGGFRVTFAGQSVPDCGGYVVAASGSRGSRASLRELIPPPCGIDPLP
jgi:hypothetical protein